MAHYTHHDVLPLPPVATGKSTSATAQSGQTYPQQVREVRGVVGSDCWDSISVFLGTDVYKRRVLCALSTPMVSTSIGSAVVGMFGGTGSGVYSWLSGSKEVATTSTPNSGIVKKTAEDMVHATGEAKSLFESTVLSLIGDLICALEDEGITAAHIGEGVGVQASKNTTTLKNDGSSGVSFIQYNPPVDLLGGIATLGAAGKVLESLVDPIFVRDLMGSYAQELR